ncbi:hypothetical protein QBC47DRAFT_401409 [Echria macrotheca]|uniref:Uncharacterized protein n=1 Tax=Echria macrotheca TaxID=438768 RepID=A0AAJ0F668_9PEZI|nr:hypothetical protein QBC47DRAFT_401409 [Echria macrotheca]
MALVLEIPSDPDPYLSDLPSLSHRHLPGRQSDVNPWAKHARRPFSWSRAKSAARHERVAYPAAGQYRPVVDDDKSQPDPDSSQEPQENSQKENIRPRPHHLALYNANVARHRTPRQSIKSTSRPSAARLARFVDLDEGRDVARARDIRLPGEYLRRPPSLERQDAFWDVRTVKQHTYTSHHSSASYHRGLKRTRSFDEDEERKLAADDAELYRLGLLYDDEYERGEGFGLDAIVHAQPLWRLAVSRPPTKKGKVGKGTRGRKEFRADLDLALSFAALGEDEALAAFLMAPGEDELVPTPAEEKMEVEARTGYSQQRETRLTVVYELEGDVEAEEVEDYTQSPGVAADDCSAKEGEEDYDWAFLDKVSTKEEEDDDNNTETTTANHAVVVEETWIMLGGL